MNQMLKSVIERAERWPTEAYEELVRAAVEIELRNAGGEITDDARAAVAEGLAQARRGEFVSDQEMEQLFKRCGR